MERRKGGIDYFRAMEALLNNYVPMQDAGTLCGADGKTLEGMPLRVQYAALAHVVEAYAARREYPVIAMRYFGQGMDGEQLPAGSHYTWEQITDALNAHDLTCDERTARRWRNRLVSDMAVCLFGAPAALALSRHTSGRYVRQTPV